MNPDDIEAERTVPGPFAVGDRVVAVGVESPADGIVVEVHSSGTYTVEWQTDYLTEVVGAGEIQREELR